MEDRTRKMKWRREDEDGDTEKHTNTGSEPKVTNFIQKYHPSFSYRSPFYRVRGIGLMTRGRVSCSWLGLALVVTVSRRLFAYEKLRNIAILPSSVRDSLDDRWLRLCREGGVDVNGCGLDEVNWVSFGNFGLSGVGVDVILLARIDGVD